MRKVAVVTLLLSLAAVWCVLLPMRFIFHQFPPDETMMHFERFGAKLPSGSAFLLSNLTLGKLYVLAALLSGAVIWLGVRAQKNAGAFAGQASLVAGWCSAIAAILLCFFLPLFRMGELVTGGEHKGPKNKFTQIQFIVDSFYPPPAQLFMQREGEDEVAIPKAEGEKWPNVVVASGTNRAFVVVYSDQSQPSDTPSGDFSHWWPSRVVQISLPLTNQPLTNYTVRTLWKFKPKANVVRGDLIPSYITPTWDGLYLMVRSRIHEGRTNADAFEMPASIFDVEQSRFLSVPPAAR